MSDYRNQIIDYRMRALKCGLLLKIDKLTKQLFTIIDILRIEGVLTG